MKKFITVFLVISILLIGNVSAFAQTETSLQNEYNSLKGTYINVFNWGEYISNGSEDSMDINAEFEKLTGIKVNYTTYDTNENMYNKIKGGGTMYDIVIPSDYMIARLIEEDLIQKLDFKNIPNYKNIMDEYKNLYFDENNEYSVPYNVGMVGIIYNTKVVKEKPTSWSIMWDKKYSDNILQFNNPRDAFATAQFLLGLDVNSEDDETWKKAYNKLVEQKSVLQTYVADEIYNKMESGEAAIGAYYAGDFLAMKENNPDLAFVYPEEGTNIFVDSMCIPKNAQNKKAAELYINFLLGEDVALANAEYLYYASPNKTVVNNEDYSLKDEKILYPDKDDMPKTVYFENLEPETLKLMSDLFRDLKATGNEKGNLVVYLGIGAVILIAAGSLVFVQLKKKKKEKLY